MAKPIAFVSPQDGHSSGRSPPQPEAQKQGGAGDRDCGRHNSLTFGKVVSSQLFLNRQKGHLVVQSFHRGQGNWTGQSAQPGGSAIRRVENILLSSALHLIV